MNVMGNDVDFFRHDLDHEIATNGAEDRILELVSAMSAVAMKPDRAVGAEGDHRVNHADREERPAEVVDEKESEWDREA